MAIGDPAGMPGVGTPPVPGAGGGPWWDGFTNWLGGAAQGTAGFLGDVGNAFAPLAPYARPFANAYMQQRGGYGAPMMPPSSVGAGQTPGQMGGQPNIWQMFAGRWADKMGQKDRLGYLKGTLNEYTGDYGRRGDIDLGHRGRRNAQDLIVRDATMTQDHDWRNKRFDQGLGHDQRRRVHDAGWNDFYFGRGMNRRGQLFDQGLDMRRRSDEYGDARSFANWDKSLGRLGQLSDVFKGFAGG